MTNRSIYFGIAAAAFAAVIGLPVQGSAAPGANLKLSADTALVQSVDYNGKRRWRHYYRDNDGEHVRAPFTSVDTNGGTHVEAPFASVHDDRYGTWVRAPFVDIFVPR